LFCFVLNIKIYLIFVLKKSLAFSPVLRLKRSNMSNRPIVNKNSANNTTGIYLKNILITCFSQFGISLMLIVYTLFGAFLFQILEEEEELKMCHEGYAAEYKNIMNLNKKLLMFIKLNVTAGSNSTETNAIMTKYLLDFRESIFSVESNYIYTGQSCVAASRWTLTSSLLFSLSIVTTIGNTNSKLLFKFKSNFN
jgi:hypothetical protein